MGFLSVIIPAYNEEKMIKKASTMISSILEEQNIDFEIIFVNDGSKDMTWAEILTEGEKNPRIKGVCFARNFGKEAAMFAGMDYAQGDCAVIIDCDLQHPPEKIVEMYQLWEQGYEVVEGVKSSRGKENPVHRCFSNLFYSIISKLINIDMKNASDFKLMDRKVINVLKAMPEKNVFFRALSSWVGFRKTKVFFDVREREEGDSKWSGRALVKYALSNITAFSAAPMQIVTFLGIAFFILSLVLGIQSLIYKVMGRALEGFTTVIIIELLIGSITMTSIGIIGYYIAKMYEELQGRPRYIVSVEKNMEKKEIEK